VRDVAQGAVRAAVGHGDDRRDRVARMRHLRTGHERIRSTHLFMKPVLGTCDSMIVVISHVLRRTMSKAARGRTCEK
jgi:hypothetical protein